MRFLPPPKTSDPELKKVVEDEAATIEVAESAKEVKPAVENQIKVAAVVQETEVAAEPALESGEPVKDSEAPVITTARAEEKVLETPESAEFAAAETGMPEPAVSRSETAHTAVVEAGKENGEEVVQTSETKGPDTSIEPSASSQAAAAEVAQTVEEVDDSGLSEMERLIEQLFDTDRCYRCNLRGVDLTGRNLSGADLEGTDLSGAILNDTDLAETNLKGVSLRGAQLKNADLRKADLYKADLSNADLTDADLRGAELDEADFTGATGYQPSLLTN